MWSPPRQVLWRLYVPASVTVAVVGLLRNALDVVAQLGDSPDEEEQLLRLWTVGVGSVGQEQSAAALAVCVGTGGLARETISTECRRHAMSWMDDLPRVDPGPADSAVAAGPGAPAVGSELRELGSLVSKVGSAPVSGPPEPASQIQACDKKKTRNCEFVTAAADSVPAGAPAGAPAPAPT